MRKLMVGALLVASWCSVGCSKKLSPDVAKIMLGGKAAEALRCTVSGFGAKVDTTGTGAGQVDTFAREWGEAARELNIIGDFECEGRFPCKAPLRGFYECKRYEEIGNLGKPNPFRKMDCTFWQECGRSEVRIDSVVTTDRQATIEYTVVPALEPKYAAVKAKGIDSRYKFRIENGEPVRGRATAILTDDGDWRLQK